MEMILSGEDPDDEIDKLLETFDVQGNFSSKQLFKGEFLANDIRLGAELRTLIGECEQMFEDWILKTTPEIAKKNFLAKINENA